MVAIIMNIQNDDDRHLAEQLYLEYSQAMFRIASAILKNENRAEDAVADAFERIIKNLDQFSDLYCNKTRGLIVLYTRNVCFNLLKRDKIIEFSELCENEINDDLLPEEIIINKATYIEFLKIISSFEYKYREVMRLKYFSGFSDAEIADMLDISQENVRIRLHRAKAKLKKLLKEVAENGE